MIASPSIYTRPRLWLALTVSLSLLLILAAGAILVSPDLYEDNAPLLEVQLIAQDYFVLVVVIPLLAGSAWMIRRGSKLALMVWLGVLLYLIYAYLIFTFCVQFNALFPVYVVLLGASIYGLIFAVILMDTTELNNAYGEKIPVRFFSAVLAVMVVLFYVLQLSEVLPAVFSGGVPPTVTDLNLPTDYTSVIDMAIYLPATAVVAVLLWQRRPLGDVLGGAVFVLYAIMMSMLTFTFFVQSRRGFEVDGGEVVMIAGVAVLWIGLTLWYLRKGRPTETA